MISQSEQAVNAIGTADPAAIRIAALEAENSELRAQLQWFKRQIFGRKSEKQILLNADQQSLFVAETQAQAQAENPGKLICEHRRRTRRCGDEVNDSGLRFDDTVPQTIVDVPAPELTGDQADQYQIIGFKDSARLAQLRSIFRVLIYRRPIVRHKGEQSVSVPAVPEAVLEGCYAGRITQRMRCILSRQAANWPPEINSRFHLPPCPVHRIHFCHEAFEMASF